MYGVGIPKRWMKVIQSANDQLLAAEYQTQARFALAQLYDRANVATNTTTTTPKEAGDAPRR